MEIILNGDDVRDLLNDDLFSGGLSNLESIVSSMFEKTTNGVFDWNEKTGEYYDHFERMISFLSCNVEYDSGEIIAVYDCEFSDYFQFNGHILSFTLVGFFSGNGEPIGAQLALDLAECFMESNQWNVGFYNADGILVTDISSWARNNELNVEAITPIVWFGHSDDVQECWSITPKTSDLFIKEFWNDYYEGALEHICDASAGLGIYYSVWEYGLDYDESIFEEVKSRCPIDLSLHNVDRANALYNLIISIYNENKRKGASVIEKDLYLQDVLECDIHVTCDSFDYSYLKPYRFKPAQLRELNKESIEEILLEDSEYMDSFKYLKDKIIDRCDLSSYQEIGKTVNSAISTIQEQLNGDILCSIHKDGVTLQTIPYSVDFSTGGYLPMSEIKNIVFMKALIDFFKRGQWHLGYKMASELPKFYNSSGQAIVRDGVCPVVWFSDSEDVVKGLGIWPGQEQYMLSLIWKSAAGFCSTVLYNIEINNDYKDTAQYRELDKEFERIKSECPIRICSGKEPVDFKELEEVVKKQKHK